MPRHSGGRWCYVTMNQERFDWDAYLRETAAVAAPRECFRQSEEPPENRFKSDMKLVTIDPRNQNSWCIATVITVQGPRMRLRLDGLDNMNDTWKLADADDIRPISWAKDRPNIIVPPLGFLPRMNLWPQFLAGRLESESAAPDSCFIPAPQSRPTGQFVVGQKLEAVDPKNPSIICVATVSQVLPDRIRVDLDGWRASYFFPITSRDLFPVGWCARAGLMLQEPGPQAIMTKSASSASSNQQHTNSPDKPIVATALARSRNSLQPQQTFLSPDMRKRRKSSESSSVNSKPSQNESGEGSARKVAKTGAASSKKAISAAKRAKDENDSAVKSEADSKVAPGEQVTSSGAVKSGVITSDEDTDIGSPLRLVIDESEGEHKSDSNATEETKPAVPVDQSAPVIFENGKAEATSPFDNGEPSSSTQNGDHPPLSQNVVANNNLMSSPESIEVDTTTATKNVLQVSPQNGPSSGTAANSSADHSGSDIGDQLVSDEKISIFVNSNCNLGPYLSSRKVAKQLKNLGPASPNAVVQDMLSLIINTATNTAEVLKLVGSAMADSKFTTVDDALKASIAGSPPSNSVSGSEVLAAVKPAIYTANDVWRLVSQITERLQCCANVFSNVRLTKACADCHRAVLARRSNHTGPLGSAEAASVAGAISSSTSNSSASQSPHVGALQQNNKTAPQSTGSGGGGLLIVPRQATTTGPSSSSRGHQTPWTIVPPTSANSPANQVQTRSSPTVEFASSFRSPPSEPASTSQQGKPSPASGGKRPFGASSVIVQSKTNGVLSGAASSTDSPPQTSSTMLSLSYISTTASVSDWTIDEVSDFLGRNPDPSLAQHAEMFKKHEIDGKALLLLSSDSILKYMGLKLGPSLKLGHLIDRLRVTSSNRPAPGSTHLK